MTISECSTWNDVDGFIDFFCLITRSSPSRVHKYYHHHRYPLILYYGYPSCLFIFYRKTANTTLKKLWTGSSDKDSSTYHDRKNATDSQTIYSASTYFDASEWTFGKENQK